MEMTDAAPFQWRVDLHVHTKRYSPCAESLDPEQLPAAIIAKGLDGVVITEHDHLWSPRELAAINRDLSGPRIYRGVEVSSRNGHFLVIGLDRLDAIGPGISVGRIIHEARKQGAAVIMAHPLFGYRQISEPLNFSNMPDGIDAIEAVSTVTRGSQGVVINAYARRFGYSAVGGSDAHCLDQLGQAFTLFDHLPVDEKELAAAIRGGRCIAGLPVHGQYGPRMPLPFKA